MISARCCPGATLLPNRTRAAGVYGYCGSDDLVEADGGFPAIHGRAAGRTRFYQRRYDGQ